MVNKLIWFCPLKAYNLGEEANINQNKPTKSMVQADLTEQMSLEMGPEEYVEFGQQTSEVRRFQQDEARTGGC